MSGSRRCPTRVRKSFAGAAIVSDVLCKLSVFTWYWCQPGMDSFTWDSIGIVPTTPSIGIVSSTLNILDVWLAFLAFAILCTGGKLSSPACSRVRVAVFLSSTINVWLTLRVFHIHCIAGICRTLSVPVSGRQRVRLVGPLLGCVANHNQCRL